MKASRLAQRKAKASGRAPAIDIVICSPLWEAERSAKAVLRRAIAAAAAMARTEGGELAIVLTDDSAIRTLNRDWRGKDQPTNVLSFSAPRLRPQGARARAAPGEPKPSRLLGDIVIAYETSAREAEAAQKPFGHHLAHLAVHGFLHLLGHDHEVDAEAEAMEAIEVAVLARLEVPDPYQPLPRPRLRRSLGRES
jgi:probable rRNA maturation factor